MTAFTYVLVMLASGYGMGIGFDLYNTTMSTTKWLRWLRPICDLLFWVVSGCIVYELALIFDSGRLRFHLFALLLIGYFLYRITLMNLVKASALAVVRFLRFLLRALWRLIYVVVMIPILFVLRLVYHLFSVVYGIGLNIENACVWLVRFISRIVLFPFGPILHMMVPGKRKIDKFLEGLYTRLSNWLKRKPHGA